MKLNLLDDRNTRYSARGVKLFYAALAATVLIRVLSSVFDQEWRIHTGEYLPRRLFDSIPLFPAWAFWLECAVLAVLAILVFFRIKLRITVRFLFVAMVLSVSQRYANHKTLIALTLFYLSLSPPDPDGDGFESQSFPQLALIQWQLSVTYLFSAINKVFWGFESGETLRAMFHNQIFMGRRPLIPAEPIYALLSRTGVAELASWLIIGAESFLPVLLSTHPLLGIGMVAALHLGFSAMMVGIWAFGGIMMTQATLYWAWKRPSSRA